MIARLLPLIAWLLPALCAADAVHAQAQAPDALQQQIRQFALAGARPEPTLRVEVLVGELDPRLRLAACEKVEPHLPPGTRLWGKARIGVRCVQGPSRWSVFLPVTVKVFGPALVATAALPAGNVLKATDLATAEVDLAENSSNAVLVASSAVGRVLAQPLMPGQSVRASHLKLREWFAAGDIVKVVAQGAGFSVSAEGQALTAGIEGQAARIRTESGRVLTGLPVADRRVELAL
jgi:flagella basal body P-ring formation protein FlgA